MRPLYCCERYGTWLDDRVLDARLSILSARSWQPWIVPVLRHGPHIRQQGVGVHGQFQCKDGSNEHY